MKLVSTKRSLLEVNERSRKRWKVRLEYNEKSGNFWHLRELSGASKTANS